MLKLAVLLLHLAIGATAFSSILPFSTSKGSSSSEVICHAQDDGNINDMSLPSSRREWLKSSATAAFSTTVGGLIVQPAKVYAADTLDLVQYDDADCKFSIKVPSSWDKSVQSLPDRRKIVLYLDPTSNLKTLISMAYTPVRDDFTSLGSFGSVDQVAQMTILPKGQLAGEEDISSEMLSAESMRSAYFFDYKQTVPGQPETHFRTIFSLRTGATGGAGAVLVTITAQTPEANYEKLKPIFDEIISSYK